MSAFPQHQKHAGHCVHVGWGDKNEFEQNLCPVAPTRVEKPGQEPRGCFMMGEHGARVTPAKQGEGRASARMASWRR